MKRGCDVYWGSHGCRFNHGHLGHCECACANDPEFDPVTRLDADGVLNVGKFPYYGPETKFYGDNARDAQRQFDNEIKALR